VAELDEQCDDDANPIATANTTIAGVNCNEYEYENANDGNSLLMAGAPVGDNKEMDNNEKLSENKNVNNGTSLLMAGVTVGDNKERKENESKNDNDGTSLLMAGVSVGDSKGVDNNEKISENENVNDGTSLLMAGVTVGDNEDVNNNENDKNDNDNDGTSLLMAGVTVGDNKGVGNSEKMSENKNANDGTSLLMAGVTVSNNEHEEQHNDDNIIPTADATIRGVNVKKVNTKSETTDDGSKEFETAVDGSKEPNKMNEEQHDDDDITASADATIIGSGVNDKKMNTEYETVDNNNNNKKTENLLFIMLRSRAMCPSFVHTPSTIRGGPTQTNDSSLASRRTLKKESFVTWGHWWLSA
jgi:hypothetical protein